MTSSAMVVRPIGIPCAEAGQIARCANDGLYAACPERFVNGAPTAGSPPGHGDTDHLRR